MKRRSEVFAIALMACGVLAPEAWAQQMGNDQMLQRKDSAFFRTAEAKRVGDQLLLYQRCTGGWAKNWNMVAPLTAEQEDSVALQKTRMDDSTIDNNATTMQMSFLAHIYKYTGECRYRDAFRRAVEFLLSGQYENGGWPQFWPQNQGYQKHITYNDNAMVNVLKMLSDMAEGRAPYDSDIIDDDMRRLVTRAFDRGIDCILATQIVVDGNPTVWCQQHDAVTLQPAKARAYELPSFCSYESAVIVDLLMRIPNPDERIRRAVNGAMKWFDDHKIVGYRLESYEKEGMRDIRLVSDENAAPMWARFYDLDEGKPMFCDRDGKPKRHLSDIGHERRNGYSWYNSKPQELYVPYKKFLGKNEKK